MTRTAFRTPCAVARVLQCAVRPTAASLETVPVRRQWRVMRNGKDIGVAFTLDGASHAVHSLRMAHWKPRGIVPSFCYRPETVKGALPIEKCVLGQ